MNQGTHTYRDRPKNLKEKRKRLSQATWHYQACSYTCNDLRKALATSTLTPLKGLVK